MSYCKDCKHFREVAANWHGDCLKHGGTTDPISEHPCFEAISSLSVSADVAKQFKDQIKQLLSGIGTTGRVAPISISIYCHCIYCDVPICRPPSITNQLHQSMMSCPNCRACFPVKGPDQPIYPTYITCISCGNMCGGFHIDIGTNPAVSQITCLACHHMWLIG